MTTFSSSKTPSFGFWYPVPSINIPQLRFKHPFVYTLNGSSYLSASNPPWQPPYPLEGRAESRRAAAVWWWPVPGGGPGRLGWQSGQHAGLQSSRLGRCTHRSGHLGRCCILQWTQQGCWWCPGWTGWMGWWWRGPGRVSRWMWPILTLDDPSVLCHWFCFNFLLSIFKPFLRRFSATFLIVRCYRAWRPVARMSNSHQDSSTRFISSMVLLLKKRLVFH